MSIHKFLIVYKKENDVNQTIYQRVIIATTKKAAIQKFYQTITQGHFHRVSYKIIEITRLLEPVLPVVATNLWRKEDPNRPKCQKYVCPYCQESCWASSYGCSYRFCPNCGNEVIIYETVDRPAGS